MVNRVGISRRRLLGTTMAGAAFGAAASAFPFSARAAGLTVGFIYVGPKDDYGYNQSHAEGAAVVKKMEGVTVVEEENVPETIAVSKDNGVDDQPRWRHACSSPTSFGYFSPFMLDEAKKNRGYPVSPLRRLMDKDKSVQYRLLLRLHRHGPVSERHCCRSRVQTEKLGFVAAKPIPQVLLNINSFLLGARQVDPSITVQVIFTGEWSLAVKEAEATNALIDQGATSLHATSTVRRSWCKTAVGRGAFVCGYHANQQPLAGDKYLTGAEWNWGRFIRDLSSTKMKAGDKSFKFCARRHPGRICENEPARARRDAGGAQTIRRGACGNQHGQVSPSSKDR